MRKAYINQISTAVPPYDVHKGFVGLAPQLLGDERKQRIFTRAERRAQIEHRYSFIGFGAAEADADANAFYRLGHFPTTEQRMQRYKRDAFTLVKQAVDPLMDAAMRDEITHVIVTTCTGFYAPGIDLQIVEHYGLKPTVERTIVGFMGCYAAINALKLAHHIVRSENAAKVLIVNIELCTLHLQETDDLEQILSFLIFADGCAASIVSAEPKGIEIDSFYATILPDTHAQITWHIGASGFDMTLSGAVPATIAKGLPQAIGQITGGLPIAAIDYWAVHPGGRTVLDAVAALGVEDKLGVSRDILRRYGNMSSATIMFVLKEILDKAPGIGNGIGCAMAFGPGVTVESMLFKIGATS